MGRRWYQGDNGEKMVTEVMGRRWYQGGDGCTCCGTGQKTMSP